jgi:hypothetical protein
MSLSKKDIIEYKSTIESSSKNKLEMKVIDDAFERDALDGWSSQDATLEQLKKLDRKIKWRLRFKTILKVSILSIISVVIIVFIANQKESNEEKSSQQKIAKKLNPSTFSKDSIKIFQELPEKLQIKPSKIIADFEEKKEFKPIDTKEQNEIYSGPIRLPLKGVEKINNSNQKRENLAKETYLHDLKVIDYRFYRSRPNEPIKNELGGTPADKESSKNEYSQHEMSIEYTYFSYLDKTMNYFRKNKYKAALNRFEVILETYPDDVNALFYSGICLYNLNRFDLCENRLLQIQNNRFTNFDQEQQWYLLLTYKTLGKKNSFDILKEKIILENGYYSKAAKHVEF